MKRTIAAVLSVFLVGTIAVVPLSGCAQMNTQQEQKQPLDLQGTWKSDESNGSYQEAIIADGTITIYWVSNGGDTKSLYWAGSYTAPTDATDTYSWTSQNDADQTKGALLASSDETKDFKYENGVLSWSASAMGTTKTVEAHKQ